MVKRLLVPTALILLLAGMAGAVPIPGNVEYGTVPVREFSSAQDECHLSYYNFCSGWVWYWSGYCYGMFVDAPQPPMFGTCFDLDGCPGECRNLGHVWWACKRFICCRSYGSNIEVYCADDNNCPIGPPLMGFYDICMEISTAWQVVDFGGLPLCPCESSGSGKFIVMLTNGSYGIDWTMYSDINGLEAPYGNIGVGCETEWRCAGHSYVYRNLVPYCDIYGMPGPMWVSGADYGCTNYPAIPPGCHNYYYNTGFFTEFLIDCYISCEGATETEGDSWGEVKRLFR